MHHPATHGQVGHFLHAYFGNKELDELYLADALRFLAGSLINIFIPIYLVQLGYDISQVALFFLAWAVSVAVFYFPSAYINHRFGIKKAIALGIITSFFFYLSLIQIEYGLYYILPAVIDGLSVALFWTGKQIFFSRVSKEENLGKNYSVFKSLAVFLGAVGPALGAFLIIQYSFDLLLVVAAAVLALAPFPLFLTKDEKYKKLDLRPRSLLREDPPRNGVVHLVWGFTTMAGLAWPLFIYFTRQQISDVGIIASGAALVMVVLELYIGKLADKKPWPLFISGSWNHAISYLIRPFLVSPVGLFLGNLYGTVSGAAQGGAYDRFYYQKIKKAKNALTFITAREMWLALGRSSFLLLFALIPNLSFGLVLAGAGSVLMIYVQNKDLKKNRILRTIKTDK